jgi:hypothetical protein
VRRHLLWIVSASALLFSLDASACRNDRECPAASHCVFVEGQMDGFCEHGVSPVGGQEERRIGDPRNPKGGQGAPCEFQGDCAEGLQCMAERDSSLRLCRR